MRTFKELKEAIVGYCSTNGYVSSFVSDKSHLTVTLSRDRRLGTGEPLVVETEFRKSNGEIYIDYFQSYSGHGDLFGSYLIGALRLLWHQTKKELQDKQKS